MGDSSDWVGAGWTPKRRREAIRTRALIPRDNPPNDGGAGPNIPPQSVGPTSSEGFGNTHVMYDANAPAPPQVQAWSGWPVEWRTPNWGQTIGLDTAMSRVSTVFSCMDLNAGIISAMPGYVLEGRTMLPDSMTPWLRNPQPEVYASYEEAMYQVMLSFAGGEAILWATGRFRDGRVATWIMLDPGQVNVQIINGVRRFELQGVDITDDVCHIPYASWPTDPRGHGPLEAAARNLVGADALEAYAANLARRGGVPWGVLKYTAGELPAGKAKDLQDQWVEARHNAAGAPAVLSGNLELDTLTINPKDMALIELRQFEESRLAILSGVPPFLAGLPSGGDSMTYQNVSALFDFHWRAYLRPRAAKVTGAITNWAVGDGRRFEVDRDDYTRPSFEVLAQAYSILHGIEEDGRRVVSVEEIRQFLRYLPSTGRVNDSPAPGRLNVVAS